MGPVGICAIFKDEAPDLLEWIAYHLSIGFDYFVMYDNGSTDGGAARIAGSIFGRFVRVIDWPERPGQLTAYQNFCERFADKFEWVAVIDVDEFVHPLEHDSIKDLLQRYADASGVQLQWLTFGPSGHIARPAGKVIDAYTMRLPADHKRCSWVKPLLRTADIVGVTDGPHVFKVRGRLVNPRGDTVPPFAQLPPCHDVVVLNHYYTKSREDWDIKRNRGSVVSVQPANDYGQSDFEAHDLAATVPDERIRRFVPLVERTLASGPPATLLPVNLDNAFPVRLRILTPDPTTPDPTSAHVPEQHDNAQPSVGLMRALDDMIALLGTPGAKPQPVPPRIAPVPAPGQDDGPVIHLTPNGRLANQMIQYMAAMKFASLVPGCRISNVTLKDWDIALPTISSDGPEATWKSPHRFDMEGMAERMKRGEVRRLNYSHFGQRMENFLNRTDYVDVFRTPPEHQGIGYGADHLVCHVRAGDVLRAPHQSYVLTPVEFYQEIVARTGLRPIFVGETESSIYMGRLRMALPQAVVLPKGDVIRDFEIIRQSTNVVVSCSTFCWLAAWLSDAARTIIFPVNGIMNPRQDEQVYLLPLGDKRYRFYLFPLNYAVPDKEHPTRHRTIKGLWREVSHEHLHRLLTEAPRVPRRIEPFLPLFDEAYYCARFPTVRQALADGWLQSGLEHFKNWGFQDGYGWYGFDLDEHWYATEYPMAAFEIAQGDYADARHHYAEIGRIRGYEPLPI